MSSPLLVVCKSILKGGSCLGGGAGADVTPSLIQEILMMQQGCLQALFHAETYHIVQLDCEFS